MLAKWLLLAVCLAATGCGGGGVVLPSDPDRLIVFSIDGPNPCKEPEERGKHPSVEQLHTYPVLGKVEVTDPNRRQEIVAAINADIRNPGVPSKCFVPRHVVRVEKDGKTVDLVICFQCSNYKVAGQPTPEGTPGIGKSAEPLLNEVLTAAGVPLAPK